ncbi:MAG: hypothetical protein ACRD12_03735 [Acidimicrobiales bacterium]
MASRTAPGDPVVERVADAADVAFRALGGAADPPAWSIREYDAARLGPLFGVSDDGGSAAEIAQAFLDSPKAVVLRRRGELSISTIGCCLDAERMSPAGELLVGLDEYAAVRRAVAGRAPMTTNVGTVVLPRFYRPAPAIAVRRGTGDPVARAMRELAAAFAPFRAAAGRPSVPATVYVTFRTTDGFTKREKVSTLGALREGAGTGTLADPSCHTVGLLQRPDGRSSRAPSFAIDVAAEAGIREVMIEGDARYEAQDQLFFSGLLAYFPPRTANAILRRASERGVRVVTKNRIDVTTAARTVWAGLSAARGVGAHLGKFGLFPLTLDQQIELMSEVPPWFPAWTPTPAFYVDRPIVSSDGVVEERDLVPAAVRWIQAAAGAGLNVVLFDSPDRTPAPVGSGRRTWDDDRGRRLIRLDASDTLGILTMEDIHTLQHAARDCRPPVRILWAGGLNGRQAYELARHGAFGIFTTSTTARRVGLRRCTRGDPVQTTELRPTYHGVLGVRVALDAAFLSARAATVGDQATAAALDRHVEPVLAALDTGDLAEAGVGDVPALADLRAELELAWERHLDTGDAGPR